MKERREYRDFVAGVWCVLQGVFGVSYRDFVAGVWCVLQGVLLQVFGVCYGGFVAGVWCVLQGFCCRCLHGLGLPWLWSGFTASPTR